MYRITSRQYTRQASNNRYSNRNLFESIADMESTLRRREIWTPEITIDDITISQAHDRYVDTVMHLDGLDFLALALQRHQAVEKYDATNNTWHPLLTRDDCDRAKRILTLASYPLYVVADADGSASTQDIMRSTDTARATTAITAAAEAAWARDSHDDAYTIHMAAARHAQILRSAISRRDYVRLGAGASLYALDLAAIGYALVYSPVNCPRSQHTLLRWVSRDGDTTDITA